MKRVIIALAAASCLALTAANAQEEGWSFVLGGGAFLSNTYVGSEAYSPAAMPVAAAEYKKGGASLSASLLDGLGLSYFSMEKRLYGSLSANFGEERNRKTYSAGFLTADHGDRIAARLEGTADVSSSFYTELQLAYLSPVGLLGASAAYHPTEISGADGKETFRHGFLYSAFLLLPVPLTDKLSLTGFLGLGIMDASYAEAWHSVPESAANIAAFDAEWGLRDIQLFLQADYMFTRRLGLTFMAANQWLLGDAKDSPLTGAAYQLSAGLYTFLKF